MARILVKLVPAMQAAALARPAIGEYASSSMLTQPKSPDVELSIEQELDEIDAELDQRDAGLQAVVDAEMARLRALGVIDDQGQPVHKDLPPDMQEGSGCDLG
jgi:hypothetical protein